jgi:hypothetical protein
MGPRAGMDTQTSGKILLSLSAIEPRSSSLQSYTILTELLRLLYRAVKSCSTIRHGGACGKRRYSSYSFLTSALDGGGW